MSKNASPMNLEDRTIAFAKNVRTFVNQLSQFSLNYDDVKQLIRSSGSVAANYIEAQEAISKRDFIYRLRIVRKEGRESIVWLKLIETSDDKHQETKSYLIDEAKQLTYILTAIIKKVEVRESAK